MESTSARSVLLVLGLALLAGAPGALAQQPRSPGEIPGLEAWYTADSLDDALGNGSEVERWEDLSGKGRHLTADSGGLPALYLESQVNGRAAVRVQKARTYSMTNPLELGAHTIVLVYRASANSRALFRGGASEGLLLRDGGKQHHYQNGGNRPEQLKAYNAPRELPRDYTVTVLARDDSSKLWAWIDGEDVSSGVEFGGPLRVVKLFALKHTQYVGSDGEGLFIAELAFFGRFLDEAERTGVTEYLLRRYKLGPHADAVATAGQPGAAPGQATAPPGTETPAQPALSMPITVPGPTSVVQLRTTDQDNLNVDPGLPVRWTIQDVVDEPFRHDADRDSERIHCTRDGTRVRIHVSLPLWTATPGPALQLLVLKNGESYLPVESWSGPFVAAASVQDPGKTVYRSTLRAELLAQLDAGDFIEIVTWKVGAEGPVVLDPRKAVLILEVR